MREFLRDSFGFFCECAKYALYFFAGALVCALVAWLTYTPHTYLCSFTVSDFFISATFAFTFLGFAALAFGIGLPLVFAIFTPVIYALDWADNGYHWLKRKFQRQAETVAVRKA